MQHFSNFFNFSRRLSALGLLFSASFVGLSSAKPAHAAPAAPAPAPQVQPKAAAPAKAPETKKDESSPAPSDKTNENTKSDEGGVATEGTHAEAGTTEPLTPSPTPPTPEELEQAKLAFETGRQAFESGDFSTAASEFKKAYQTVPSAHAEYWIARSLDQEDAKNENTKLVVDAYGQFLSNPGASHVGSAQINEAQTRLMELKKLLPATIQFVTTPAGASVTLDGNKIEGVTPLSLELSAGAHKLEFSRNGYEATLIDIHAEGGDAAEQQITLIKIEPIVAPVATGTTAESTIEKSMIPAYVTLGLGGAGLVSGTVFGIMALTAKGNFKDEPTLDHADAAERNALIADMSFGIALTLGITGIVLLTAQDDEEDGLAKKLTKPGLVVAPYGNRHGGGAAARLTF